MTAAAPTGITDQLARMIVDRLTTLTTDGGHVVALEASYDGAWFIDVRATRYDLTVEGDQVTTLQLRLSPAVPVITDAAPPSAGTDASAGILDA